MLAVPRHAVFPRKSLWEWANPAFNAQRIAESTHLTGSIRRLPMKVLLLTPDNKVIIKPVSKWNVWYDQQTFSILQMGYNLYTPLNHADLIKVAEVLAYRTNGKVIGGGIQDNKPWLVVRPGLPRFKIGSRQELAPVLIVKVGRSNLGRELNPQATVFFMLEEQYGHVLLAFPENKTIPAYSNLHGFSLRKHTLDGAVVKAIERMHKYYKHAQDTLKSLVTTALSPEGYLKHSYAIAPLVGSTIRQAVLGPDEDYAVMAFEDSVYTREFPEISRTGWAGLLTWLEAAQYGRPEVPTRRTAPEPMSPLHSTILNSSVKGAIRDLRDLLVPYFASPTWRTKWNLDKPIEKLRPLHQDRILVV